MKKEKELKQIYKKYIDIPLYRVVSGSHYKDILKKGLDPRKNPHKKLIPDLKKLIKLLERFEKKGYVLRLNWGFEVDGSYAMKVTLYDISIYVVDFTPRKDHIKYYLKLEGGAAVSNIKKITSMLLVLEDKLSRTDKQLIKRLKSYCKKSKAKNKAICVKGSSKCLETAYFQVFRQKNKKKKEYKKPIHWQSPFGSFDHFKKVVEKNGLEKYLRKLKKKEYYLRARDKIPAKEIKRMR